jgi:hypothetical protein
MPRRDQYHDCVRRALVRDGWTITHDPLVIPFRRTDLYVDLGADRFVLLRREPERTCFLAVSHDAYEELLTDPEMLALTTAEDLRLVGFDPVEESIKRWIPEWTSAPS